MKYCKYMKINKNWRIIGIISVIVLFYIVIILSNIKIFSIYSKNINNDYSDRIIDIDKFSSLISKEGCVQEVNAEKKINKEDIIYFYKSKKESCNYDVFYIASLNSGLIEENVRNYSLRLEKENSFDNLQSKNYLGVQSRIIKDNNYTILIYNKISLLYIKTSINYKKDVIELLTGLGYKIRMIE